MSKLPLSRFKVIDLTRVRAGPTCVRQLADWGADCIKVENPEDDGFAAERHGSDFQNLHRNKRSIAIDLKKPEGVAILKALVKDADVLVENYRPDVKFRLGIDYETLKAVNKRLVYASISGFGQDGPYGNRPGFDPIAQGMGGLMAITGLPGQGPVRAGIPIADLCAGIFAAQGIFIALLEREESGEGQWVQSSLLTAMIAMLDFQGSRWTMSHEVPGQEGNNHPTNIPAAVYRTQDGHINIAASSGPIYTKLCQALGAPELATDPRFANFKVRRQNRDALNALIDERTATRTSAEWVEAAERSRRAERPDLQDERGLRRSAGEASEDGAGRRASEPRSYRAHRPADVPLAHAVVAPHRDARARRAYGRDLARPRLRRGYDRQAPRGEGGGVTRADAAPAHRGDGINARPVSPRRDRSGSSRRCRRGRNSRRDSWRDIADDNPRHSRKAARP